MRQTPCREAQRNPGTACSTAAPPKHPPSRQPAPTCCRQRRHRHRRCRWRRGCPLAGWAASHRSYRCHNPAGMEGKGRCCRKNDGWWERQAQERYGKAAAARPCAACSGWVASQLPYLKPHVIVVARRRHRGRGPAGRSGTQPGWSAAAHGRAQAGRQGAALGLPTALTASQANGGCDNRVGACLEERRAGGEAVRRPGARLLPSDLIGMAVPLYTLRLSYRRSQRAARRANTLHDRALSSCGTRRGLGTVTIEPIAVARGAAARLAWQSTAAGVTGMLRAGWLRPLARAASCLVNASSCGSAAPADAR